MSKETDDLADALSKALDSATKNTETLDKIGTLIDKVDKLTKSPSIQQIVDLAYRKNLGMQGPQQQQTQKKPLFRTDSHRLAYEFLSVKDEGQVASMLKKMKEELG